VWRLGLAFYRQRLRPALRSVVLSDLISKTPPVYFAAARVGQLLRTDIAVCLWESRRVPLVKGPNGPSVVPTAHPPTNPRCKCACERPKSTRGVGGSTWSQRKGTRAARSAAKTIVPASIFHGVNGVLTVWCFVFGGEGLLWAGLLMLPGRIFSGWYRLLALDAVRALYCILCVR
jgi:hypothetical protein